jgi:hypothetical protein
MICDLIAFLNLLRCLKIDWSTKKLEKEKEATNIQQMQSHKYDPLCN